MKKPRLTKKVIRGLQIITREPICHYLDGSAEDDECSAYSKADLSDAAAAEQWIRSIGWWAGYDPVTRRCEAAAQPAAEGGGDG